MIRCAPGPRNSGGTWTRRTSAVFCVTPATSGTVHRHRVAPLGYDNARDLESRGVLALHAGRLHAVRETDDGRHRLEAAFRPRGGRQSDELQTLTVDAIINATGPEADYDRNPDPLVVNLRARGLLRPDRHRMGVDVDDNTGALRDAAGRPSPFLFTLGSPRRGSLYETIAVAEIRAQAAALVAAWLAQDNDNAPDPEPFGPVQRFSPTDDSVRLVRLPR